KESRSWGFIDIPAASNPKDPALLGHFYHLPGDRLRDQVRIRIAHRHQRPSFSVAYHQPLGIFYGELVNGNSAAVHPTRSLLQLSGRGDSVVQTCRSSGAGRMKGMSDFYKNVAPLELGI